MRNTILGILLVLSLFSGLGFAGWYAVKKDIAAQAVYQLDASRITVPERPPWVPADFIETALRNSNLAAESFLLDKDLPHKLSQAFAASPWAEDVEQVRLQYPSGAVVRLTYRVPAALVDVSPRGSFPVDRNGVLLPTEYFIALAPDKMKEYLQIRGIHSSPLGAAGTLWGDPLVHDAAGLAGYISDVAAKLKIAEIVPFPQQTPTGSKVFCKLITENSTEILWGRFEPDDPKNEARKKHLLELAELYRSLDDIPKNFQPVDLTKE
ncbi:MAG: hypothetical protein LBN39_02960 [Planctomycetaceae bacterium]|jgi:hypothetical protein|nr:hypothetical protein [Planctomycetaceae bacterium]